MSRRGQRIGPVCVDCGGEKYAPRAMRCGECARVALDVAQARYRETNKESRNARARERDHARSDAGITRNDPAVIREWRRQNAERVMWHSAKRTAKLKGLPFSITPPDVVIPETCPVFGMKLSRPPHTLGRPEDLASLDRIIPERGYVRGNVWVISWRANRLKNNASVAELEQLCAALKEVLRVRAA